MLTHSHTRIDRFVNEEALKAQPVKESSPGPKYVLPSTLGSQVESSKRSAPAQSFGVSSRPFIGGLLAVAGGRAHVTALGGRHSGSGTRLCVTAVLACWYSPQSSRPETRNPKPHDAMQFGSLLPRMRLTRCTTSRRHRWAMCHGVPQRLPTPSAARARASQWCRLTPTAHRGQCTSCPPPWARRPRLQC